MEGHGKPPLGKNGFLGFFLPELLMLLYQPALHKKKMVTPWFWKRMERTANVVALGARRRGGG